MNKKAINALVDVILADLNEAGLSAAETFWALAFASAIVTDTVVKENKFSTEEISSRFITSYMGICNDLPKYRKP